MNRLSSISSMTRRVAGAASLSRTLARQASDHSGLRGDDAVALIAGTKVAWVLREKPSLLGDASRGSREENLVKLSRRWQ